MYLSWAPLKGYSRGHVQLRHRGHTGYGLHLSDTCMQKTMLLTVDLPGIIVMLTKSRKHSVRRRNTWLAAITSNPILPGYNRVPLTKWELWVWPIAQIKDVIT